MNMDQHPEDSGMGHNEISRGCREVLVQDGYFATEREISQEEWDGPIYDFATKYRGTGTTVESAATTFREEVLSQIPA